MRAVLTVFLLLFATHVSAAWQIINRSDGVTYYIDIATVRKDGNVRRSWQLGDFKVRDSDGALSYRGLVEYDCKEELVRLRSYALFAGHMANGKLLYISEKVEGWMAVAPETVGETQFKYVCEL